MTLYKKKYRVETIRKWDWDYSAPGWYFITICTQDRKPYFGRVKNGTVELSSLGIFAESCWKQIPAHHRDVAVDEFIVMPNHIHGIIVITGTEPEPELISREKQPLAAPSAGTLGTIVRSYKAAVSKFCRERNPGFTWQPRYYDKIALGPGNVDAIRKYMRDNPANWNKDKHYVGTQPSVVAPQRET